TSDNVLKNIKGNDLMATYVKQSIALLDLIGVVEIYSRNIKPNDDTKIVIENQLAEYKQAQAEILRTVEKTFSKEDIAKYNDSSVELAKSIEYRKSIIENLYSEEARLNLKNINNPNY